MKKAFEFVMSFLSATIVAVYVVLYAVVPALVIYILYKVAESFWERS